MKWCPKCKEEFEDEAIECNDCGVKLVDSPEDIYHKRMLMVLNSPTEAEKVIEYLYYSNIESGSYEQSEDHQEPAYVVYVEEEDWAAASRRMAGYVLTERQTADQEEQEIDEYETVETEAKPSEHKSLCVFGGGLVVVGILILTGVISFFNLMVGISLIIFGLFLGGLVYSSAQKAANKQQQLAANKQQVDAVYDWYVKQYPVNEFFTRNQLELQQIDPGAVFFRVMDQVVKECSTTELSNDQRIINTASERIANRIVEGQKS